MNFLSRIKHRIFQPINLDLLMEGIIIWHSNDGLVYCNKAALEMLNFTINELRNINKICSIIVDYKETLNHFNNENKSRSEEIKMRTSLGEILFCLGVVKSLNKNVVMVTFFDDSANRTFQKNLIQQTKRDKLTGLYNRKGLYDRADVIYKVPLTDSSNIGVLFIDLDGFKPVNDTHGHDAGDKVLIEISKRFEELLDDKDTCSRIGGDEFVFLIPFISNISELKNVANCILDSVKDPISITEQEKVSISCSIGASVKHISTFNLEETLKQVDIAMYNVKQNGKNGIFFIE